MREYLNANTLFNTIAMLRSASDGLILIVEGSDDRHAVESHMHRTVTVLCGQGGKPDLLHAATLVEGRGVADVRFLIDRDYDDKIVPPIPYADCVVASTNHDVVMDLLLADRTVIHRVIDAHTRGTAGPRRVRAEQVLEETFKIAARVSLLRMLSVENEWELNMSDFPFGRFNPARPNPQEVVELALSRSKPGPKRTPVLRHLRAALKADAADVVALIGDHDCFGAMAYVLRSHGYTGIGDASLATSFFAAIDCSSVMKTNWFLEITTWSTESANAASFVCPCPRVA